MGNILMLQNEIKEIEKKRVQIPAADSMDSNYRRLKYVRYADDFLIGVIGSKEDSQRIKADIKEYLESKLKLELSEEKTLITHGNQPAKFLGFDVYIRKTNEAKRDKNGVLKRFYGNKVVLKVTTATMRKKLLHSMPSKLTKSMAKRCGKVFREVIFQSMTTLKYWINIIPRYEVSTTITQLQTTVTFLTRFILS